MTRKYDTSPAFSTDYWESQQPNECVSNYDENNQRRDVLEMLKWLWPTKNQFGLKLQKFEWWRASNTMKAHD